ncbi:HAUS augmin-like complex subunit 4 [Pimephales promelas]|uniref:HAUS augmin-like complex subunit 4 n=1 Tax=Pimephales promelas TaxID=90988 RepID=UPI001955A20B|nr:HAUS augmin-like complex subunit 4 [Pimephales promelas]XP_039517533.1 HAUS augmin-like complex subunit 4 [Pimephales promelas]KAG1931681.1 HAUS augmin-like complex subunit [Pimephales promelas]
MSAMSERTDCVFLSALGKGDNLHQQVLSAFPLCEMTEEDLIQNPLFCKLLATLSQHVDRTGLTQHLRRDLEKAECELRSQRLSWLREECVNRVLREIVQEIRFTKASSSQTAEDKFFSTLEQCVMVGQCVKSSHHSGILGLMAERVTRQMPPEQDIVQMKQRLPSELLQHLKRKAVNILTYYQPQWENESEGLRSVKLSKLPELLDGEQKKAKSLAERNRENTALLQRQTHAYLSELVKCMKVLQCLVLDLRLKAQKDLDRKKIEYFEAKCEIGLQKIRAEMLEVQLDTYTRDKIAAHKKITEKLNAELKSSEMDRQAVESKLASFEIYGRDFEALADEYSRLRQEIATKSWALKEFST